MFGFKNLNLLLNIVTFTSVYKFKCLPVFTASLFRPVGSYMSLGGGGVGGGGLKVSPPPYEIFDKGYPPPT
jgi:hypothetical protein